MSTERNEPEKPKSTFIAMGGSGGGGTAIVAQGIPTADELAKLPRWATVAFVARCLRRVRPWAVSDPSQVATAEWTLNSLERSASEARVAKVDWHWLGK